MKWNGGKQLVSDKKQQHKHPIQNHRIERSSYSVYLADEPWSCGTAVNKIDPCGKLFSHAEAF